MTRHGLRKRSVRPGDRRGDARTPVMDNYHWDTTPVVVRVRADDGSPGRAAQGAIRATTLAERSESSLIR
jgi:hypothetical protein